jgi:L-ribulose-5-phosphate 3-epimerase UlaE
MRELTLGDKRYTIHAVASAEGWVAHAERVDTGDRFGIECIGASLDDAIDRMARWLDWQHEHVAALEALQQAEAGYHRTVAASAFTLPDAPSAQELQSASLEAVDAARIRLDEVRGRKP